VAGVTRTISVDLGAGLVLPTPVMIAAGCAGTGEELVGLLDMRKVGAVLSRSVTLAPRRGSPTPRIAESPSGIVWETGLQNPGIDVFVSEELPKLAAAGTHVIVSVAGGSIEEFVRLTGALQGRPEVAALETCLSGPDDELEREELGVHVDRASEVVGAVARMSMVPTFAKLPMHAPVLPDLARAVVRAGAHGITVGGSPPALSVQGTRLRPALGSVTGWLSGPALKPQMLRAVFEVARAVPETPVVAVGGIRTGEDAIEAILAGAWAVQLGTAVMIDPSAPLAVAQDIVRFLKAKGMASPADLRSRLRVPASFDTVPEDDDGEGEGSG
jgi:dihydroorotate dehydrogenase (NAD+) catalytic subunit